MDAVKQWMIDFLNWKIFNFPLYLYLVISTEIVARANMGAAFAFKKKKARLKKDAAQRSIIFKIMGFYHLNETNAPHHMKKYAVIRVCNLISLVFEIVIHSLIPHIPILQPVFSALMILHLIFLFVPFVVEAFLLSNIKKYGKMPDFDLSGRP